MRPKLTAHGTRCDIVHPGGKTHVELRLIGTHNVYNALAAVAAAAASGLDAGQAAEALNGLRSVPGRLEPVEAGQPFRVFVDYAHTADALETVLSHLKEVPHARIITVFGCGGDRDKTKRGPMGVAACRGSDLAIVTTDNPRSEDPGRIIAEIEEGIVAERLSNYRLRPDRGEAIIEAVRLAGPDDIVLIAGKGHEGQQVLADRTVDFDDREAAREAIRSSGRNQPSTST